MSAQEYKNPKICYNLGFQTYFDNREFASSPYDKSGTLFGARIYPEVGLVRSLGGAEHRLMLGADFRKNFLQEFFFYYQAKLPLANGDMFRLYAGVIPSEYRLEGLDFSTPALVELSLLLFRPAIQDSSD